MKGKTKYLKRNRSLLASPGTAFESCLWIARALTGKEARFAAFKDYSLTAVPAERRTGCHLMEIVEDTEDTFQFNVT